MGCCFSCNENDEDQGPDSTERQQLIRETVNNSSPIVQAANSEAGAIETNTSKGQEDELQRILQETASAMIDVSGSGSHSLDQREFNERTRQYQNMLQKISPSVLKPPTMLLGDFPNPEKQLGSCVVSAEDAELMEWAMSQIQEALHSIRVEQEEDLVVSFGTSQQTMVASPTPSS